MSSKGKHTLIVIWLFWICMVGLLLITASTLCFRFDLLTFKLASVGIATGLFGCLAAGLVALLLWIGTLLWQQNFNAQLLFVTILGSLPILTLLSTVGLSGLKMPPIHDISTDTANPPVFVWAAKDRLPSDNSTLYGGDELARKQREAYPDIAPLEVPVSAEQAFTLVQKAIADLGWRELGRDDSNFTIEAMDRTLLFGFKDDIVVRVTPLANGSRIDVRSASRIGIGDAGTNARRIKVFFNTLNKHRKIGERR